MFQQPRWKSVFATKTPFSGALLEKPETKKIRTQKKRRSSRAGTVCSYRSHFEGQIAKQLETENIRYRYEARSIHYESFGYPRSYWPDFEIITVNGPVFLECKGWLRTEDRWKLERVRIANPEIDLRICFWEAGNPIETGQPEIDYGAGLDRWPTVGEWADALGIRWCERELPHVWLEEWKHKGSIEGTGEDD